MGVQGPHLCEGPPEMQAEPTLNGQCGGPKLEALGSPDIGARPAARRKTAPALGFEPACTS